jgi:hypothetical protein
MSTTEMIFGESHRAHVQNVIIAYCLRENKFQRHIGHLKCGENRELIATNEDNEIKAGVILATFRGDITVIFI